MKFEDFYAQRMPKHARFDQKSKHLRRVRQVRNLKFLLKRNCKELSFFLGVITFFIIVFFSTRLQHVLSFELGFGLFVCQHARIGAVGFLFEGGGGGWGAGGVGGRGGGGRVEAGGAGGGWRRRVWVVTRIEFFLVLSANFKKYACLDRATETIVVEL